MGNAVGRFKELCLDTTGDGEEVGRFWAAATGCQYVGNDRLDYPGDVVGAEEGMGIAICRVPEAKTVKNRVHLDLHALAVDDLLALGATVDPVQHEEDSWTVMHDPEGNEFCAFVRPPDRVPAYKVYELGVDCADAVAIGSWWAEIFGVEIHRRDDQPWCWLEGVPGFPMEAWVFAPVPEPKTVKNRLHWDLYGDVADFEARGATRLWDGPAEELPDGTVGTPRWIVMADPEGNEFCVFPDD
ncbi:MAG TPA: VOC family protein [Marmoricola sp.]|nr:VOC family protein [Marmoricola sp.]